MFKKEVYVKEDYDIDKLKEIGFKKSFHVSCYIFEEERFNKSKCNKYEVSYTWHSEEIGENIYIYDYDSGGIKKREVHITLNIHSSGSELISKIIEMYEKGIIEFREKKERKRR